MGLDFTKIQDREGAAVYLLHDGTITQQRAMDALCAALTAQHVHGQAVVLSARERDGEKVRDFYDLDAMNFPHVLIVADDDRLLHHWSGRHIPPADQVTFLVKGLIT